MARHSILGVSKVASLWASVYNEITVGSDIRAVLAKCGEPDEFLDLGETKMLSWISEEWKGCFRGGTITRKMVFVIKDGKVISKTGQNLGRWAL